MHELYKRRFVLRDGVPKDLLVKESCYDISTMDEYGVLCWKVTDKTEKDKIGLYFELLTEKSDKYKHNKNIIICISGSHHNKDHGKDASYLYSLYYNLGLGVNYGYPNFCNLSCGNSEKCKKVLEIRIIDTSE